MSKFITVLVTLSILFCLILSTISINISALETSSTSQTQLNNSSVSSISNTSESISNSSINSSKSSQSLIKTSSSSVKNSSSDSNSNSMTNQKKKVKVIDGEIDLESEVKMTKVEKERFEKCKKEVKLKRSKRIKNKPTPCVKKLTQVNDHITNEDYNILWEQLNQQVENTKGVDMDKEIPLSDYINQNELEIDNSTESSSSSSTNSIVSLSSSINSPSINSQSTSTSSDTKSSTNSVDNISNLSSVSSKSISYISSSSEVQSVSYISTNNTNSSSSQPISFLDIFLGLGGVRIDAATNDGWRLPYQAGQKPELRSRPYDPTVPTHTQYAAFDFGSANNIIVAGKSGKVIYIAALTSGFGNHIVIQSNDGSLAIYAHLSSFNVGLNADITRGQQIGVEGTTGNSSGQHLHFETMSYIPCSNGGQTCWGSVEYKNAQMIPQFDECYTERGGKSTTVVNCSNGYPYIWWKFFESINSSTPTGGFLKSYTNNNMLFDIVAFNYTDQAQVTLYGYNVSPNQRWYYNSSDETIRNPISGRCLDSGDVNNPSNRWLRINWCNGGNNQKWIRASDKNLRTRANESLCVDSASGNTNGSYLYLYNCTGQWNQQFDTDDLAYSGGYSNNPMYESDKTFNFGSQVIGSYTNPGMVFDVDTPNNESLIPTNN